MLKSFLVTMILSTLVKRCFVSRSQDFFIWVLKFGYKLFTSDMWYVTWYIQVLVNIISKFQIPSSDGFWFKIFEVVCRTAPAAQGFLNKDFGNQLSRMITKWIYWLISICFNKKNQVVFNSLWNKSLDSGKQRLIVKTESTYLEFCLGKQTRIVFLKIFLYKL